MNAQSGLLYAALEASPHLAMAEKPEILPNSPAGGGIAVELNPAKARRKSKLIVAMIVAAVVIVAVVLWFALGSDTNSRAAGSPPKSTLVLVPLEGFIVNLIG